MYIYKSTCMIYDMDDMYITCELHFLLLQDVDAWRKLQ